MPASEPYRPVPAADEGGGSSPPFRDAGIVADLERAQDERELRGRERSLRVGAVAAGCLLAALAFGGREYYARNYGSGSGTGRAHLFGGGRIRGSDGVDGPTSDLEDDEFLIGDDEFLGGDDGAEWDLILVEGSDDDGGVEEFEGDVDDEIENGEIEGDFDTDMDYDQAENLEDEDANWGTEEGEEEEEEDYLGGLGDVHEEDATKEGGDDSAEGASPAEEPENEFVPDEEIPDYFVPLTPDERDDMRERLRATVRETRAALLWSDKGGDGASHPAPQRTLVLDSDTPKQFMHMHHMKTGGTSVDSLLRCALNRQKALHDGNRINYNKLSECGSRVRYCMDDLASKLDASVVDNVFYRNDDDGNPRLAPQFSFDPAEEDDGLIDELNVCGTSTTNVMSYCASLHAVRTFGWEGVDKVTVIRDPVDRAWSMYRFSLKGCYKCVELKDVLKSVVNGTFVGRGKGRGDPRDAPGKGGEDGDGDDAGPNFVYDPNDSCAVQMIGHQATNLLSSRELYNVANDARFPREREIAEEAVRNLRETFTWIGITDRIGESIEGFRAVFPFLAENLNDAAGAYGEALRKGGEEVDGGFSLPADFNDEEGCPFEHRNAGRDPTCGTKEMDEETIHLIKKISARDMAVYQAAVERFELQQEVLAEFWDGTL